MKLGSSNLSPPNALVPADLKSRALTVLSRTRRAIQSGRIALPEKTRAAMEWELLEVQKLLDAPRPSLEVTSIFPAAWLKSRWEAVFCDQSPWYPYITGGGSPVGKTEIVFIKGEPPAEVGAKPLPDALIDLDYVREQRARILNQFAAGMFRRLGDVDLLSFCQAEEVQASNCANRGPPN